MAAVTWDSYFAADPGLIFKGLYGSAVVKDYAPGNDFSNFSPFDSATGNLSTNILGTEAFLDVGYLDENGMVITPKYTVADTMAWQDRAPLRKDVTADSEELKLTGIESTPLLDCLRRSIPLAQVQPIGTSNYNISKPKIPLTTPRSFLGIAVDNGTGSNIYKAVLYPKCVLVKPEARSFQAKTELQTGLTFEPLYDKVSGFAVREWTDGPGWRLLSALPAPAAPVATAVSGAKATLTFAPPASGTAPFTYTVGIVPTASGATAAFGGTATAPTATVSSLTVGTAYTFTVTATDNTGKVSPASAPSNSITAIT